MHNLRRGAVVLAVATVTAAGAACGGSDSPTGPHGSPSDTIAGSFALSTVNTSALPATIASDPGNYSLEITAGSAVLQGNGTQFIIAMTSKETVAGHVSTYIDSTRGTWTQLTGAITLTMTGGVASTGTWDGTNLTIVQDGDTYLFKKQ